ncbi:MAG: diacylglycerol kinase family lipid kinase [Clostridiales bacterium]|jgi:YegS/Rv2252/BmrU family lipid kinase|nr:diacylglycerol kinase family lipid kinase [Clostridiales bacterium]
MYHFIVNLKAGRGYTRRIVHKLERFLNEHKLPYTFYDTFYPGNAIEIAHRLSEIEGIDRVIAVGGDGTFNEVLNGVNPDKTVIGFIPAGSGNDFARAAGFSLNPVEALQDVVNDKIIEADYMEIGAENNFRRCVNIAGTGLDIEVLTRYNRARFVKNKLQYYWCLLRALVRLKTYKVKMTLSGATTEHDCFVVAVCNGQYFGGGMRVSPNSDIYDGQMDVVIIHMIKRSRIPGVLLKFFKGRHIGLDFVEVHKTDYVELECETSKIVNIDGELLNLPFKARLVKGGLKMYAPSSKAYL